MTTTVWPFFRAECSDPRCHQWSGHEHLSLGAAEAEAAEHDAEKHQVDGHERPMLRVVEDSP